MMSSGVKVEATPAVVVKSQGSRVFQQPSEGGLRTQVEKRAPV